MTTKFKYANNARVTFSVPVIESTVTFVLAGAYDLLPTTNGKLTCTKTVGGVVTKREIIFYTTRTGGTLTGITRAYEACPISDAATSQSQVAQTFDAGDALEQLVTAKDFSNILDGIPADIQNQTYTTGTTGGTGNAITLTLSTPISANATGQRFSFVASANNTTSATLQVDGKTAKTIKKLGGSTNLVSGDIVSGMLVSVEDFGTYYMMLNPVANVPQADIVGTTLKTSTVDADLLLVYDPALTANRSIAESDFRMNMRTIGGNGSDGAVDGTADITITGSNNTHIIKNFSSWAAGTLPSQAYTNDPAAGSSIVLNMASTALFAVGDWVQVSSSAGAELAQVTAVAANVSITVDTLGLNHTTTTPVVKRLRKLTITPTGCTLEIRVAGNCDLTGWYIDGKGKGALGGAANGVNAGASGLGVTFNVAGGNAGVTGYGSTPTAQASIVTTTTPILGKALYHIAPGGGGGAGYLDNSVSEGGGNGGLAVYFEVGGTLTFSATTTCVDLRGNDGTNTSTYGGAGGGGGGGAGFFASMGTITGTPITKLTGGTGSGTQTFLNYQCSGANGGNSVIGSGTTGAANMGVGGNGATGYFTSQRI